MDQMSGQKLAQSGNVQQVNRNVQMDCSVLMSAACVMEAPFTAVDAGMDLMSQQSYVRTVQLTSSGNVQMVTASVSHVCVMELYIMIATMNQMNGQRHVENGTAQVISGNVQMD